MTLDECQGCHSGHKCGHTFAKPAGLSAAVERLRLHPLQGTAPRSLGQTRRRPVEVIVDKGRPVTVRFTGDEEEDLEEVLDVQVGHQATPRLSGQL